MSKRRYVALKEFFYKYPYKKNKEGLSPNTIPSAYIKKDDVSDHVGAIDFNFYQAFIKDYLKNFVIGLALGEQYDISYIGSFKMMKKYMPRKVNVLATIQANDGKGNKDNIKYGEDDYFYRIYGNRFLRKSYKRFFKVTFTKNAHKVIQNEIKKNPYLFNRGPTTRH